MGMIGENPNSGGDVIIRTYKGLQELGSCVVRAGSYRVEDGHRASRQVYAAAIWANRMVHALRGPHAPSAPDVFDYSNGGPQLVEDGVMVLEQCSDVEGARELVGRLLLATEACIGQDTPFGPIDLEGLVLQSAA